MKTHRDLKHGLVFLAVAACFGAYAMQGALWLLLAWPALSFGLVGVAYLAGNVRLFGKRGDGSRRLWASVALAPYLAFVHLVWFIWRCLDRRPAYQSVDHRLIVARRLLAAEYPKHVTHVFDLTCEFLDPRSIRSSTHYRSLPMLDAGTLSALELAAAVRGLRIDSDECLLIHCANGHGRTGLVAAAWLISQDPTLSIDAALERLRAARPPIRLRPCQRATLERSLPLLREENARELSAASPLLSPRERSVTLESELYDESQI